jgi:SAM-dependent methyltransferase
MSIATLTSRVNALAKSGGPRYTAMYALLWCLRRLLRPAHWLGSAAVEKLVGYIASLESHVVDLERRRGIVAPWSISAGRFTTRDNQVWWNGHDWSRYGEEWTPSSDWKSAIVQRFIERYLTDREKLLEIGPGAGRWTEHLQTISRRLYVLDLASRPLVMCRDRFRDTGQVFCLLGDGKSIPLADRSVDGIWSYDVFVHVNPVDARSYFAEFARVLRPGGYALIHHPGVASTPEQRKRDHRSDLTDGMVRAFAADNGLETVLQTTELVNVGDVLTIVRKPALERHTMA